MATSNSTASTHEKFTTLCDEYCISMDAYLGLAMGEIEKHNSDDFDGLKFLTEAAQSKMFEFGRKIHEIHEAAGGDSMNTTTLQQTELPASTEESRTGALACLFAMQAVMKLQFHQESEGTIQDYHAYLDEANEVFLKSSGQHSEFMQGFVSTLAEFFSDTNAGGINDVFTWKPSASMSAEELADYRDSLKEPEVDLQTTQGGNL